VIDTFVLTLDSYSHVNHGEHSDAAATMDEVFSA
jgi:hypothetical protein